MNDEPSRHLYTVLEDYNWLHDHVRFDSDIAPAILALAASLERLTEENSENSQEIARALTHEE
jgi:hypothetical protein